MRANSCLVVLGLTMLLPVSAAEAKSDADSRAAALASYLDEDSFALVRFDATKFDLDANLARAKTLLSIPDDQVRTATVAMKKLQADFLRAGGTEAIMVFSAPELPAPSFVFLPLKDGADVATLTGMLRTLVVPRWQIERKGNRLIAGETAALARLRRKNSVTRPELAPALAATGDSCLQFLLLPTPDQRRVIEEVAPISFTIEGVSFKELARNVRWAALGLNGEPKGSVRLTVQSTNAATSEKVARLLKTGISLLGQQPIAGEEKVLRELFPAEYKIASAALAPTVTGDKVTMTVLDADSMNAVTALIVASPVGAALEARQRMDAQSQMKMIALGLRNYAAAHGNFPPTAIRSKDGKPLLSWRVQILPFVEQEVLYKQFHLDEPWDSEHNKKLIEPMPRVYRSPKVKDERRGLTTYLVPVGKEVAFTGAATGRRFPSEFPDGVANTILLLDVADQKGVVWTKPDDLPVNLNDPMQGLLGHYQGIFLVGLADATVHKISKGISKSSLRSLFTCAGGETIGPDFKY